MTAIVNGFATTLVFALIDPQISALTDDVVDGSVREATLRREMARVSSCRLPVPAAVVIACTAGSL